MPKPFVRDAELADTDVALEVLRQSIIELCVEDHQNDPATLHHWLSNKTPEHFAGWLADLNSALLVAELDGSVRAVGSVDRTGRIGLCYVEPGFERSGIGGALLEALEGRAMAWRVRELSLDSSLNARSFYVCHGYESMGEPVCGFGAVRCYPFKKALPQNL
jgi:putative acetyltransferase